MLYTLIYWEFQKPDEKLQIGESNTDDKQSISRDSVGEFIQAHVYDTDKYKKEEVMRKRRKRKMKEN